MFFLKSTNKKLRAKAFVFSCLFFLIGQVVSPVFLTVHAANAKQDTNHLVISPLDSVCAPTTKSYTSSDTPQVISTGPGNIGESIISVPATFADAETISDINVITNIDHPFPKKLNITLTHRGSESDKTVTLTSRNGPELAGVAKTIFTTRWDDQANKPADRHDRVAYPTRIISGSLANGTLRQSYFNNTLVTDHQYPSVSGTFPTVAAFAPEEPLGAFIGDKPVQNANADEWVLSVQDTGSTAPGRLVSWSLEISVITVDPAEGDNGAEITGENTRATKIPDAIFNGTTHISEPSSSNSSIALSAAPTERVYKVEVTTEIYHGKNSDLQIALTSPLGTTVTLSSNNGDRQPLVFTNTVWKNDANPGGELQNGTAPNYYNDGLATDQQYNGHVNVDTLAPEESLAAFFGESPIGAWKLTVADVESGGNISDEFVRPGFPTTNDRQANFNWSIKVFTITCPLPTPPAITSISPNPGCPNKEVTITGTNFAAGDSVVFTSTAPGPTISVAPNSITPTQIKVTVPSGLTNPVTVTVVDGFGQISNEVTFNVATTGCGTPTPTPGGPLTIVSFNPPCGVLSRPPANATEITVFGSGFKNLADPINTVKVGSRQVDNLKIDSDTKLRFRIPTSAVTGTITITLNSGVTAQSSTSLNVGCR